MTHIQVFDPAMCCSTGVCGPTVDPKLVKFAADLDWLKAQGVAVERFNLSQQPMVFAQDADVKASLQTQGEGALPLIKVDGQVKSRGIYPSRDRLAEWVGVALPPTSIFTEAVQELVSIGAAIAANCEPCFKFHYDKARKLGVTREDMQLAVQTAQRVKEAPAAAVLHLAERYLAEQPTKVFETPEIKLLPTAPATSCCGGSGDSKNACC
jgi:AhpD family alkylhydroperoxidase